MNKYRYGRKSSSTETRGLGERGQVILMVGLATLVMFGIVGLAVDVGRLYVTRVELGRSVDSAALSGILEFDGTAQGLTDAEDKAEWYFDENEPNGNVTRVAWANPNANEMTMDATKTINMIFLSVLGIHTASVSAHAKSGFGTQYLDAVLVLDATPSMAGNPITQAKAAAITFKNILLGTNPQGNVVVGATAFRGCFKPSPTTHNDCVDKNAWKTNLTSTHATLDTVINAIAGGGGNVGTNVCTGLAMGYNIISGAGNHNNDITYPGNRQYLILLSDGDNYYPGNNTWNNPIANDTTPIDANSSPMGAVVGNNEFPCQPIDSCGSPWNTAPTQPCIATPDFYSGGATLSTEGFESNDWVSGTGWTGGWTTSGSPSIITAGSPAPQQGSDHARLRSSDMITRQFDLSGATSVDFNYYEATTGQETSSCSPCDNITVRISTNGTTWTTLRTISGNHSYQPHAENLDAYAGQATVYIRFDGNMSDTTDNFFVDNITITTDSSNGFLNGNDGSNPATCNQDPKPRERQLDTRTLKLAQAIKSQEVEIFVVAFSGGVPGCNLNNVTVYNDEVPSECNAVNQSAGPAIPGVSSTNGPIGDNTHDGTANHRLLKCMASNTQGTLDHYFFANDEDELEGIFTQIANQIAHRLIE